MSDTLADHSANTIIHITAEEREAWNKKATVEQVNSAKDEAISIAAADATKKAESALSDAKTYSDGLNTAMDNRVKVVEGAITWKTIV